ETREQPDALVVDPHVEPERPEVRLLPPGERPEHDDVGRHQTGEHDDRPPPPPRTFRDLGVWGTPFRGKVGGGVGWHRRDDGTRAGRLGRMSVFSRMLRAGEGKKLRALGTLV